jgi:hypothetical protein
MELLWQRRAKATHRYRRESVTAIPRLRAGGRIQAWRVSDGEAAKPIYAPRNETGTPSGPDLRNAA